MLIPILKKVNREQKTVFIGGDFNIDLLKMSDNIEINNYFDQITNNNFMPLITIPTRITSKSKT